MPCASLMLNFWIMSNELVTVSMPVAPFWGKRRDRITFVRVYKAEIETEPQPNLATATDTIHTLSDVLATIYVSASLIFQ